MRIGFGAAGLLTVVCLLLAGCSAGPLKDGRSGFAQLGGDIRIPMTSLAQRRFATVVRQQYDFSCGSAALATLLTHHYADPQAETAVFVGMWQEGDRAQIRQQGFSLLDMKRYLRQRGMDGNGYRVTLDQIKKTGLPGIAMIETKGYRHFIAVKGVYGQEVLVGDPAFGIKTMPVADFTKAWNGIYFVVEREGAKPAFNAGNDWSLIGRARTTYAAEPHSLQAANLSALGFQEF